MTLIISFPNNSFLESELKASFLEALLTRKGVLIRLVRVSRMWTFSCWCSRMKRRKISRSAGSEMLRRKRSRYAVVVMTSSTVTWSQWESSTGNYLLEAARDSPQHPTSTQSHCHENTWELSWSQQHVLGIQHLPWSSHRERRRQERQSYALTGPVKWSLNPIKVLVCTQKWGKRLWKVFIWLIKE